MTIKIIPHIQMVGSQPKMFFVANVALPDCCVLVGCEYDSEHGRKTSYFYIRQGMKYSYGVDGDVLGDWAGNGRIVFFCPVSAVNTEQKAYKSLPSGQWKHIEYLKNYGTSFEYKGNTYEVEATLKGGLYGVHNYFNDFVNPMATEVFNTVAGWFTSEGSKGAASFSGMGVRDKIEIVSDIYKGTTEEAVDSSFRMTLSTSQMVLKSFSVGDMEKLSDLWYCATYSPLIPLLTYAEGQVYISKLIKPQQLQDLHAGDRIAVDVRLDSGPHSNNSIKFQIENVGTFFAINGTDITSGSISSEPLTQEQVNSITGNGLRVLISIYSGTANNVVIESYNTLNAIKQYGISISVTSNEGEDGAFGVWAYILAPDGMETALTTEPYPDIKAGGSLSITSDRKIVPYFRVKNEITNGTLLFAVRKGNDNTNASYFYADNTTKGQGIEGSDAKPIEGRDKLKLSYADINENNFKGVALPVSECDSRNSQYVINGVSHNFEDIWDDAVTLTTLCIGPNPYVTCDFKGMVEDADTIIASAIGTWAEAAPYNDIVDGEIVDGEGSDEQEEDTQQVFEERTEEELIICIKGDDIDEEVFFDANKYIYVGKNNKIVSEEDVYTTRYAVTPVYEVFVGDRVNISGEQNSFLAVDAEEYKNGNFITMPLPEIVHANDKIMFACMKDVNKEDTVIHVEIKRAAREFPVPITNDGRRKKTLMGEDCITIAFTLDEQISFPVGSYIDDKIFGRFFIVEEQMPKISDGSYKYELTFEAWHMFWKNKKYMFTALNDTMTGYVRKEMTWTLTNNLKNHALAVIHNLQATGIVPAIYKKPVIKTFAKNYIMPYAVNGYANIMAKYKMGVNCIFFCDGLVAAGYIEINTGYNSNKYGTRCGNSFSVTEASFYLEETENGYIDAYDNTEKSLSELKRYSYEELRRGVTFGDATYILNAGSSVSSTREAVRISLGMQQGENFDSLTDWHDTPMLYPLMYYINDTMTAQLILNGNGLPQGKMLLAVIQGDKEQWVGEDAGGNIRGLGAFVVSKGDAVLRAWYYNNGSRNIYTYIDRIETGMDFEDGYPPVLYKLLLIDSYDASGVRVGNGTYTWEKVLDMDSSVPFIAPYVNDIHEDDTLGIRIEHPHVFYYTSREAVAIVQQSVQDTAGDAAYNSEITTSGGENILLTDEELSKQYLVIHEEDILKRTEALTISISGKSIFDGLKEIANTFECEYWVEYDNDFSQEYKPFIIHFGKCEKGKEQYISDMPFVLNGENIDLNAVSISASNDTDERGNKIYVFGGTENMPFSYRKKMKATEIGRTDSLSYIVNAYDYYAEVAQSVSRSGNPSASHWYYRVKGNYIPATETTAYAEQKTNPKTGEEYTVWRTYYEKKRGARAEGTLTGQTYVKLQVQGKDLEYDYFPKPIGGEGFNVGVNIEQTLKYVGKYRNRYYYALQGDTAEITEGLYSPRRTGVVYTPRIQFISAVDADVTISYGTALIVDKDFVIPTWINKATRSISIKKGKTVTLDECQLNSMFFLSGKVTAAVMVVVEVPNKTEAEMMACGAACGYYWSTEKRQILYIDWYRDVVYSHQKMRMVVVQKDGHKAIGVLNEKSADNDAKYYTSFPCYPFSGEVDIINPTSDAPLTWYIQDTDSPSSLLQIGENRLLLPNNTDPNDARFMDYFHNFVCVNGYIVPYNMRNNPDGEKTIERAVIFNEEYPKAKLFVKSVLSTTKTEYEDAEDGNTYARQWYQYTLELMDEKGNEFQFDKNYITNETLKMRFLVPEDVAEEFRSNGGEISFVDKDGNAKKVSYNEVSKQCKLAGMTFEVEYKQTGSGGSISERKYVIVRNEDFGAKLPNDILLPQVGDPVVLINWNTKAIEASGIVQTAEQRLMEKGFEYAAALAEDNFTLNADMMSDWMFKLGGEYQYLIEKQDKYLIEKMDKYLLVRKGYDTYIIPEIGQRVCVRHDSLKNGEKHTRIIGYELKLDKPYDTPKLTIGESEAYSRIKQLEKNITKLS